MSRNKKIILSIIILIIIITVILITMLSKTKEQYQTYTCKKEESIVDGTLQTTYIIKYQESDVKKVEYILKYYGKSKKEKDNISTLSKIVKEEARLYEEQKGFSYRVNRQIPTEFKITYYFDLTDANIEFLNSFHITNDLKKQKEYFTTNEEYTCQ